MGYDETKTFSDFERLIQNHSRQIIEVCSRGEELYKDLVAYKGEYGSNAAIATKLGVDVGYIDDLEEAVVAMHKLFNAGEGAALTTGDYFNDLRRFT